jgi:hypothetical protein
LGGGSEAAQTFLNGSGFCLLKIKTHNKARLRLFQKYNGITDGRLQRLLVKGCNRAKETVLERLFSFGFLGFAVEVAMLQRFFLHKKFCGFVFVVTFVPVKKLARIGNPEEKAEHTVFFICAFKGAGYNGVLQPPRLKDFQPFPAPLEAHFFWAKTKIS